MEVKKCVAGIQLQSAQRNYLKSILSPFLIKEEQQRFDIRVSDVRR